MKQDHTDPLLEWFKATYANRDLPKGHGQRFAQKIAAERQKKRQRTGFRVAAMVLVLVSLGTAIGTNQQSDSPEMNQFYQTEAHFQSLIQNQWDNLPLDQKNFRVPIAAAQFQMERLQFQYQQQMEQFQNGTDHPKLLHAMITNLQKQLEILKDLQQQIETINVQNDETELL